MQDLSGEGGANRMLVEREGANRLLVEGRANRLLVEGEG